MNTDTRRLFGLLTLAFFLLGQSQVFAQQISGTVTDAADHTTLPGVNITVKGTSLGTSTDSEGNYQLTVPSLQDTLVFSFIGYETQFIAINEQTTIDVELVSTVYSGGEMVVVGYGRQSKTSITGSISNVGSAELTKTPAVTTSEALVGKIQGITTRHSDARPGGSTNLQIRNMGNPLFVIDGVPASAGEFNQLGQNDIEDISVLKDASAAVYGLRASNGVVLVTTKEGRGPTRVNISGYYGVQNYTRLPQPGNAYEYIRAKIESAQNYGQPRPYTAEELENWRLGGDGYKSYDYYDIVMRPNVPQYSLNASVSGGSETISYFLSMTHLDEQALIPDYSFNRNNLQANVEGQLLEGLSVGAQISGRIEDRSNVGVPGLDDYFNPFLSVYTMWPTESPYANDNPDYVHQTHNVNVNPATYTKDITGYVDEIWRNFKANLYATYEFDFGVELRGTYSYGSDNMDFDGFEYTYSAYRYDEATGEYYTQEGWGNPNPWREIRQRANTNRFMQLQANYRGQFGDHGIRALAAYERSDFDGFYNVVHTIPPNNYIPIMYFSDQDVLIHELSESARAGYVARINYDYKEKYMVEVLGRYDGSFLFPSNSRWGLFPAASAGWRISEEDFFQNALGDVISNLKIRASYGKTGSETWSNGDYIVSPFSYISGYNYGNGSFVFDGDFYTGIQPRGLPITNLSWIDNITTNIGLDFGLFDEQITGAIDLFERQRKGLPASRYDVLLPWETGFGLPPENLESDAIRGIEGAVNYTPHMDGDFKYSIGINATFARNRVVDIYKPRFGNSFDEYRNAAEGRWSSIPWGQEVIGRFQSEEEIENYPVNIDGQGNRTMLPGDFIYKDVNDDGIINWLDERPTGYGEGANPYMTFGINGNFTWKGLSLDYGFAGATMQSFYRYWELLFPFQNDGNSPHYMLNDRWHRADPFDDNSPWVAGTHPAIREGNNGHSNYWGNDFWRKNISYIRLRNLELGYDLPIDLLSQIGLRRLRVYARGTNLFSIDNVRDLEIDPEISSSNALVYPQQRMYTFGFNVTL